MQPALQQTGSQAAQESGRVLQSGANILADVGDAAFKKGGPVSSVTPALSGVSNVLHQGSQALYNMNPNSQAILGGGLMAAGSLTTAATAAALASKAKKKSAERMAGQQPIVY